MPIISPTHGQQHQQQHQQHVLRSLSSQGSALGGSSQVRTVLQNGHLATKIVKPSTVSAASRQLQSRMSALGSVQAFLSSQHQYPQQVQLVSNSKHGVPLSKTSSSPSSASTASSTAADAAVAPTVRSFSLPPSTTGDEAMSISPKPAADAADAANAATSMQVTHELSEQHRFSGSDDLLPLDVLASAALTSLQMDTNASPAEPIAVKTTPKSHVGFRLLSNLLEEQNQHMPAPNFLHRIQKDEVQEFMRHDILEWLMRVNRYFQFQSETFSLAVNYFDRFLSVLKVKPSHLQLIAVTSLLIAAKLQEQWNTHPALRDLTTVSNMAFSCNDIVRMEKIMLLRLNWSLNAVTPHVLVHQLVPLLEPYLGMTHQECAHLITVAESYLDLAHLEYRYCWTSPSLLACGALLCALSRSNCADDNKEVVQNVISLCNCDNDSAFTCYDNMRTLVADVAPPM